MNIYKAISHMKNMSRCNVQRRIVKSISTEGALKDIIPFQYSQEVLTGRHKIILTVDPDLKKKG